MKDSPKPPPVDGHFKVVPPESRLSAGIKSILVLCLGTISAIYILNPGAGFIEFLPDNIPVIGNIDEATATVILVSCLAYFGIDVSHFLKKKPGNTPPNS